LLFADFLNEVPKNSVRWVEGGLGALAFLALCKVGLVQGLCVPCNVLKIVWGRVGKVMDA